MHGSEAISYEFGRALSGNALAWLEKEIVWGKCFCFPVSPSAAGGWYFVAMVNRITNWSTAFRAASAFPA